MPKELPENLDTIVLSLAATRAPAHATLVELTETARLNLNELKNVSAQLQSAQQKLAAAEGALSESKVRQTEAERQSTERTAQAARLEGELRLARAQLTQNDKDIASLQTAIGELQQRLKAAGAQPGSRPIVDLVSELRTDAARLLAKPFRAPDSPAAPGVVIDGLEFEIRGSLVIDEKVGLRTFAADQSDPAAASVMRFSIKPEMRIEVPDEDKS